ncbi:MAG: hypothetical protein IJI43_03440 [Bacilli bacterium]|nr:hypothetical protein [Bacilli bacterium]
MDKVNIEALNRLNNEELLSLYDSINDHIKFLNENIIKAEEKKEEEESNESNGE